MGAKLTEVEKWQRKADRATAKEKAAAGLFAEYVEPVKAEDLYWKWRQQKAGGGPGAVGSGLLFIDAAGCGLKWLQIQAIERHAAKLLGVETATGLAEYARRVFPMPDYGHHVWAGWLTKAEPLVFEWTMTFDPAQITQHNLDGRQLVPLRAYSPTAPAMSRDEFTAMFPALADVQKGIRSESDDPTNVFDRTIGALKRAG